MHPCPIFRACTAALAIFAMTFVACAAERINGVAGAPTATATLDGKQLPPLPLPFKGVTKQAAKDPTSYRLPRVVPPKGAPNVLLIMSDAAGFGVSSPFGGDIPPPAMDRVAKNGLRYPYRRA